MSDDLPESPEMEAEQRRQTVILLAILVEGGLLVVASLLGWMVNQPPLRFFAWSFRAALWGAVAALPLIALFFVLSRWPIGPLQRIQRFSTEVIRPLFAPCSLLDFFGVSALAGLGEEILFRGVVQEAFAGWFNAWVGVAVAAVLFGLMHAITLTYALLAVVLGAYLGCVYVVFAEHNLFAIVVTHGLYDFVVLIWLMRGPGAAAALEALQARQAAEKSNEPPS